MQKSYQSCRRVHSDLCVDVIDPTEIKQMNISMNDEAVVLCRFNYIITSTSSDLYQN